MGRLEEYLDTVGGQPILDNGCGVKKVIIPVEKPLLLHQDRPLHLHVLHKNAQDLHDVGRIDNGPPENKMQIDEASAVRMAWTLSLIGPSCPFFIH